MEILETLKALQQANRIFDLERVQKKEYIEGDFEGSVTGTWVRRNQNGSGVVEYNGKNYVTQPIGLTAIPKGTAVELTYAKGVYYSKW